MSAMDADSEFQCLNLLLADFYAAMHRKEGKPSFVKRGMRLDWADVGLIDDPRISVRLSARRIENKRELLLGLAIAPGMTRAKDYGRVKARDVLFAFYDNTQPYEDRVAFMERAIGPI